jgi:hypothetical protein
LVAESRALGVACRTASYLGGAETASVARCGVRQNVTSRVVDSVVPNLADRIRPAYWRRLNKCFGDPGAHPPVDPNSGSAKPVYALRSVSDRSPLFFSRLKAV